MNELKFSKRKQLGQKSYTSEEFKEMTSSEYSLQSSCELYLLRTGWVKPGTIGENLGMQVVKGVFIHVPNQAFEKRKTVARDYLKNLPDLMLFHSDGRFLAFELKARKGKRQKGQRALAKYMPIIEEKVFERFVKKIEEWY